MLFQHRTRSAAWSKLTSMQIMRSLKAREQFDMHKLPDELYRNTAREAFEYIAERVESCEWLSSKGVNNYRFKNKLAPSVAGRILKMRGEDAGEYGALEGFHSGYLLQSWVATVRYMMNPGKYICWWLRPSSTTTWRRMGSWEILGLMKATRMISSGSALVVLRERPWLSGEFRYSM